MMPQTKPLTFLCGMKECTVVVLSKHRLCASRRHPSIHLSILRQEEPDMLLSNFSLSSSLWVCSGKERGECVCARPGVSMISSLPGFPGQNNPVKLAYTFLDNTSTDSWVASATAILSGGYFYCNGMNKVADTLSTRRVIHKKETLGFLSNGSG